VNVLDIERPQPLFDQVVELDRERGLLDVVFTLEQIDGVGRSFFDLLADGRWRRRQNASRMALTMVRANSVLIRSSALRSF
jgi:hypothetical protein